MFRTNSQFIICLTLMGVLLTTGSGVQKAWAGDGLKILGAVVAGLAVYDILSDRDDDCRDRPRIVSCPPPRPVYVPAPPPPPPSSTRRAYDAGYRDGYDDGQRNGYTEGWGDGRQYGYREGSCDGYRSGYDNGFDDGYKTGNRDKRPTYHPHGRPRR